MRRTNLVRDGELLDQATKLFGLKTYSATVNHALEEVIRLEKIKGISRYFGTGIWQGDPGRMRDDSGSQLRLEHSVMA